MGTMMSQQEAKRAQIMEQLTAGNIDQKEAAKIMDVTVRQTRRILKRYRTLGIAGLISKKRGQPSNRRLNEETKQLSIELIGAHYHDFGPTLAQTQAQLHGDDKSAETGGASRQQGSQYAGGQGACETR